MTERDELQLSAALESSAADAGFQGKLSGIAGLHVPGRKHRPLEIKVHWRVDPQDV